jgi:hypothetical protein
MLVRGALAALSATFAQFVASKYSSANACSKASDALM